MTLGTKLNYCPINGANDDADDTADVVDNDVKYEAYTVVYKSF
ncbi:MAG: hypothetical protein V1836_02225 [Candidatus Aenigmatarchaeota archaeon]